jgi:hypothetical protein
MLNFGFGIFGWALRCLHKRQRIFIFFFFSWQKVMSVRQFIQSLQSFDLNISFISVDATQTTMLQAKLVQPINYLNMSENENFICYIEYKLNEWEKKSAFHQLRQPNSIGNVAKNWRVNFGYTTSLVNYDYSNQEQCHKANRVSENE